MVREATVTRSSARAGTTRRIHGPLPAAKLVCIVAETATLLGLYNVTTPDLPPCASGRYQVLAATVVPGMPTIDDVSLDTASRSAAIESLACSEMGPLRVLNVPRR